jgi:hypothetical protein
MSGSDQMEMCLVDGTIVLEKVGKGNGVFGKLFFEHYPQSKGIVGRTINYLVWYNEKVAGIIGGSSPPKNYKIFVKYFDGFDEKHYLNNNVFRLITTEKNLGTRILRIFRNNIKKDYEAKYKDELVGLVTFVEMPRTGALYKADNWDYLGITEGIRMYRRGENWEKQFVAGEKKHIFGYKY